MSEETDVMSRRHRRAQEERASATGQTVGPRRRNGRMARKIRRLLPHLALLPFTALWVYPFAWILSAAFKTEREMLLGGFSLWPQEFTLDNLVRAWQIGHFGEYTLNTIIFSVGVVFVVLLVSAPSGYALSRKDLPGRKTVIGILVLSMFIPHGYTIIPIFKLVNALGLDGNLAGAVLAMAAPTHAVPIMLFMGYFGRIPAELEQAARIDGAGIFTIFCRIMLPLAKPVLGVVTLFTFIGAWNAFFIPLVFTLGNPEMRTLGVGMYNFFAIDTTDWTGLAAAALIGLVPVVTVFLFLQKTFVEGIAGAVKN